MLLANMGVWGYQSHIQRLFRGPCIHIQNGGKRKRKRTNKNTIWQYEGRTSASGGKQTKQDTILHTVPTKLLQNGNNHLIRGLLFCALVTYSWPLQLSTPHSVRRQRLSHASSSPSNISTSEALAPQEPSRDPKSLQIALPLFCPC